MENEVFFEQALTALKTGIPFHAKDKKTDLIIDGVLQTFYFNYSFIPLKDQDGNIYGVMNTGVDVTELHLSRLQTH
jgi:hypothetical protein